MSDDVKGVNLRYEPKHPQKPWGVWVEVVIGEKELRGRTGFASEAEAQVAYEAACAEIRKLRAEYEEDERRRKALAVPELPKAPKGATLFETLTVRWLDEHVKEMLAASTYRSYNTLLTNHLLPIMRTWPVTDEVMTPHRLKDVLKRQLSEKGVHLATRVQCQRCLSAMFGWALGELQAGQFTQNPLKEQALYIRKASEKNVRLRQIPNPMTPAQAEAFLAWVKENRREFWELFLWLVDAGSRLGEVCALRLTAIDFKYGRAHIVKSYSLAERWMDNQAEKGAGTRRKDPRVSGEKDTKTHRSNQYIDLSDRLFAAVTTLKTANLERWMARGRFGKEPEHVFLTNRLMPRRPSPILYRVFREACHALQLVGQTGEPFTIHCLRDTFATLAILSGKHIGWVSMMLGHASEDTTRTHYYRWVRMVEDNPLASTQRGRE